MEFLQEKILSLVITFYAFVRIFLLFILYAMVIEINGVYNV